MSLLKFLQVSVFANFFVYKPYTEVVQEILIILMADPQLDVRVAAAETLAGFIHCAFLQVDKTLIVSGGLRIV